MTDEIDAMLREQMSALGGPAAQPAAAPAPQAAKEPPAAVQKPAPQPPASPQERDAENTRLAQRIGRAEAELAAAASAVAVADGIVQAARTAQAPTAAPQATKVPLEPEPPVASVAKLPEAFEAPAPEVPPAPAAPKEAQPEPPVASVAKPPEAFEAPVPEAPPAPTAPKEAQPEPPVASVAKPPEAFEVPAPEAEDQGASTPDRRAEMAERQKQIARQIEREKIKTRLGRERLLLDWLVVLLVALIAMFCLTQFVLVNAEVPTESMEDTISVGDRVIGYRLAYISAKPQRGEIIIFRYPDDERQLYIKRIVGLPGETVQITNGVVYINGEETPEVNAHIKDAPVGDFGPFDVPQDSYFVLGDNRNYSWDSRYWKNPFVAFDKIEGKAGFRLYPGYKDLQGS